MERIQNAAMQHLTVGAVFLALDGVGRTERRHGPVDERRIGKGRHAELRPVNIARPVKAVHALGVGSRESKLQAAIAHLAANAIDQGVRQHERERRILLANGNLVGGVSRRVRFPIGNALVPVLVRNLHDIFKVRVALAAAKLPAYGHGKFVFQREGILREIFGTIERRQQAEEQERRRRVRLVERRKQARRETEIQDHVVLDVPGLPEQGTFVRRTRGGIQNRFRRNRRQIANAQGLHLVAVQHALIRNPTVEGGVIGLEQARRQKTQISFIHSDLQVSSVNFQMRI